MDPGWDSRPEKDSEPGQAAFSAPICADLKGSAVAAETIHTSRLCGVACLFFGAGRKGHQLLVISGNARMRAAGQFCMQEATFCFAEFLKVLPTAGATISSRVQCQAGVKNRPKALDMVANSWSSSTEAQGSCSLGHRARGYLKNSQTKRQKLIEEHCGWWGGRRVHRGHTKGYICVASKCQPEMAVDC